MTCGTMKKIGHKNYCFLKYWSQLSIMIINDGPIMQRGTIKKFHMAC
jgi:hypothetical protein